VHLPPKAVDLVIALYVNREKFLSSSVGIFFFPSSSSFEGRERGKKKRKMYVSVDFERVRFLHVAIINRRFSVLLCV
jgi:hypothetical protein